MPSISRGRQIVFFFLNWYHNFLCFLWTCPIEFGLAYLKSHSSLFSDVLCIYNFYVCSVSIKLSWASVNCQILKFSVVIQYLIWFLPQFSYLDEDLLFQVKFFASKDNHKRLKLCNQTTGQENLKGAGTIKWLNRILTLYFSVHVTSIYIVNITTIPTTIKGPDCNFDFLTSRLYLSFKICVHR